MKLKTSEDIEATIEQVFEAVSDFDGMERAALRRGAEVKRSDTLTSDGVGMAWHATFPYRNRSRVADMELTAFDTPNRLTLFSKVSGMDATIDVDLVSLSRSRTRLVLSVDMRPKTISARLLIQSMKIARSTIMRRFRKRVADYAQSIEEKYRTGA